MTQSRSKPLLRLLPAAACGMVLLAAGCATPVVETAMSQTGAAASDAIGMPRERPGPVLADADDPTVPTPYGGHGSDRVCLPVARDIARLTMVLGPDSEVEAGRDSEETSEDRTLWDRGRDLLSRAPDAAEDASGDAYRSAIVGLNPARPVGRYVFRADQIESQAREARQMAQKRRAYLRGMFDGQQCRRTVLEDAFREYGLMRRENGIEVRGYE
ncbi:hypothetical protein FKB34_09510 [Glycocaulis profundi]|nr:hypothetical protein FKB34_09510 [Glycocaulis profundi]